MKFWLECWLECWEINVERFICWMKWNVHVSFDQIKCFINFEMLRLAREKKAEEMVWVSLNEMLIRVIIRKLIGWFVDRTLEEMLEDCLCWMDAGRPVKPNHRLLDGRSNGMSVLLGGHHVLENPSRVNCFCCHIHPTGQAAAGCRRPGCQDQRGTA